MPTNLPPEYFAIEKRYRQAGTTEEKVELLQELLSVIPKHKGTEHLRGDLKKRLAKLKVEAQSAKSAGKRGAAWRIEREGAGQVVLAGPTNVGKSALVVALTNAAPEVSEAPYTTWTPVAGMTRFEDVQIQLVDTPPLNPDFVDPEVIELIKRTDLLLLVVDLQADPLEQLEESVAILEESRIIPQHRLEQYAGQSRIAPVPMAVLANKADDGDSDELLEIFRELAGEEWAILPVSATTGRGLDPFRRFLFDRLKIIRVYSKAPGRDPELARPFVLPQGSTVTDFATQVHHDFAEKLKLARVWGNVLFEGQSVPRDHVLHDRDIVELHI